MQAYHFIASNHFEIADLKEVDQFVEAFPDFQTIHLDGATELHLLLKLLQMDKVTAIELPQAHYAKYWDISAYSLPEFDQEGFDQFYKKWIEQSGRTNNMDEYGSLLFLQGLSAPWNHREYRLIVSANETTKQ